MSDVKRSDVLSPLEVESYITAIDKSEILELGSLRWLDKHERIKQLTIQSVIQVLSTREETVKEGLITHEKLPILVHELILVELWREFIFPEILKQTVVVGFSIYPILYHESTCINLLETVMYHSEAAETLGDAVIDLADYCLRSLNHTLSKHLSDVEDDEEDGNSSQKGSGDDVDLKQQSQAILMGISVKSLSCLRYVIENIQSLGSGLVSRLVVSSDTPMLLAELIVCKPWRKENWREGKVEDFDPVENCWKPVDPSARILINPKTELQAWLSLYLLLKDNSILCSYELYDARKNSLLRLRSFLNEMALEQVPILTEFSIFLNQLAVTTGPFGPSKCPLLLEMIPPIRDHLEAEFKKNKKQIVDSYVQELIHGDRETLMEKARKLASAYDFEQFQSALPTVHSCAKCGKEATKKCSKCKQIWYCCRECQVSHWCSEHKNKCSSE